MTRSLRVLLMGVLAASLLIVGLPGAADAATTRRVTLSVSKSVVDVNAKYTWSGVVSPGAAGLTVNLQYWDGSRWSTFGTTKTRGGGRFTTSVWSTDAGVRKYRVTVPATRGYTSATSRTVYVSYYRWLYLRDMDPVEGSHNEGQTRINGQAVLNSVWFSSYSNSPLTTAYDLGRSCTTLRGRLGLTDDSQAAAQVQTSLTLDATQVLSQVLVLGQSQDLDLDVRGYLRLTIIRQDVGKEWNAYPGFGDARAYCAF